MKRFLRFVILFITVGCCYLLLELFFRAPRGDLVGMIIHRHPITFSSFVSWTSLWMIPIGGVAGIFIGYLNEWKWSSKLPIAVMAILAVIFIDSIELITGFILIKGFKMPFWDYSEELLNFKGLICLKNSIAYYFISPFAMWFDDLVKKVLKDVKMYSILDIYKRMLTGK